jgi:single-strand DNA-binding protein
MAELRLASVNKVLISGRLTRDAEVRYTPAGSPVSTLPLAINRRYKSQDGEWRSEATYVNVVAWDKLAERAGQMAKKGAAVMVEGRLQSRSYEAADGGRRSVLEVRAERLQFLDRQTKEADEGQAVDEPEHAESKDMEDAEGESDLPF